MFKILRDLAIVILSLSLIYAPLTHAAQLALPSGDLIAPQISHEPPQENVRAGSSQQIKATITDNVGIKTVTLFYRHIGSENYKRIQMNKADSSDEYVATLGFEETQEPGIEYYIQAVDLAGNALLHGYSFSPLKIGIAPEIGASDKITAQVSTDFSATEQVEKEEVLGENRTNKWLWIGLGVLAVGVVAAVASGGSDDGGTTQTGAGTNTGTISLTAPVPGN